MKYTFRIVTSEPDSQNDKILIDGIRLPANNKVPLLNNFDSANPIGVVEININKGEVIATAEIPDHLLDATPAIGFKPIKYHDENGIRVIDEMKIYSVGLCASKNADPYIKTIREQMNDKL